MTVKGQEITANQLVLWSLGGCITLIFAIGAYYLSDVATSLRSLREDMATVKVETRYAKEEVVALRKDQDDLRQALYSHIVASSRVIN
jgi:hypothetical protein